MTTHPQAKPAGTPTWIDLMTPDIDAARAFYQAVFGWEYDIGGPEFGGYTTARMGQRMTAGLMGNQPDAPPMPAAWSLYFATDNIEADVAHAVEEASDAGVSIYYIGVGPTRVDPLPDVFGARRSTRIKRVEELPRVLAQVHRELVAA